MYDNIIDDQLFSLDSIFCMFECGDDRGGSIRQDATARLGAKNRLWLQLLNRLHPSYLLFALPSQCRQSRRLQFFHLHLSTTTLRFLKIKLHQHWKKNLKIIKLHQYLDVYHVCLSIHICV